MGLKERILDFVNVAQRSPQLASDPKELLKLQRAALDSRDGLFGGAFFPVAKYTWEVSVNLLNGDATSERIPFQPPFPARIVGMQPWVEVIGTGFRVPTAQSVLVNLDINESSQLTNSQGRVTTSASKDSNYVTLASLGVATLAGLRLFDWKIESSTTAIGFTFKWKQGGAYDDAIVGVSIFATDIDDAGRPGAPR